MIMNHESHRLWRNRNAYALTAALSVFVFLHALYRLLAWKNFDITTIIEIFTTGFLVIRCSNLASSADSQLWSRHEHQAPSVEDRLDELERLKRRDMVTPEEYAVKRQEILGDL